MGFKRAADQFQVSQKTLERYVRKKRADPDYAVVKSLGRFTSVFSKNQEEEPVAYLHQIEDQPFGLTIKELRTLTKRNSPPHPFKDEAAGLDWVCEEAGTTKEKPVLLLLDGHTTHTRDLALVDMARNNGVILLCFSHKLQHLNSFMKPPSKYYKDELPKWLRNNPGKVVTMFQIAMLFGNAYMLASTILTTVNGFWRTEMWPLDKNVSTEADFLPYATIDIALPSTLGMGVVFTPDEETFSQKQHQKVPPLNFKLPSIPRAKRAKKATASPLSSSKSDKHVDEDECLYCHDYSEEG
ncbi:hypothetical protein ILUMI_08749 [Ignelater luminosus]|uniref:DDE-1 domain-containing protein n=1 Tax=Ignelater luminosus TaxID=2038154 RepID=A0A8K0D6B7_IGNLU|nr:hypothetical protein ILUMI_08749 [Ignelater luminosus]